MGRAKRLRAREAAHEQSRHLSGDPALSPPPSSPLAGGAPAAGTAPPGPDLCALLWVHVLEVPTARAHA